MKCNQVQTIAALFCTHKSNYKKYLALVYDLKKNALNYSGNYPVIAHPPCRKFSKLRGLSNAPACEKFLAYYAVATVRKFGGIVEHPLGSTLWKEMNLPLGSQIDEYGGFTIKINQSWFGHPAKKPTLLYIVGLTPSTILPAPLCLNAIEKTISSSNWNSNGKKEVSKGWKNRTPIKLVEYLIANCLKIEQNEERHQP